MTFAFSPYAIGNAGVKDIAAAVGGLADQAQYMIFNPTMQQLALQDPAAQLEVKMKQCEMGGAEKALNSTLRNANVRGALADLASSKFKDFKGAGKTAVRGKQIKDPEKFDQSKFGPEYCDSEFPLPASEPGSCSMYFGSASEPDATQIEKGNKAIEKELSKITNYRAFLAWQSESCVGVEKQMLDEELKIYECKEGVMKEAVALAAGQVQNVLQANQGEFQKGQQFVAEVGDQMRQVDELLGPEDKELANAEKGGNQFQGLLGIQKALNDQLNQMNSKESDIKQRIDEMKQTAETNEQTLESERMGEVSKCMKEGRGVSMSGGRALTCFVPVTDAKTNRRTFQKQSCGPMQWLKSQISQSAFITKRGVMQDQRRTEESEAFGAEFESLQAGILRDLGEGDAKLEGGAKLVTREASWTEIARKHTGAMQELSNKTGVNVSQQLNAIAGTCFSEGDTWRKQQKRSKGSPYNKTKAEIQKKKDTLNGELRNNLSELNKSYADAMSVLSGQVANLNRYNCTNDDPEKMQECFGQMKQGVADLLEGNGMSGTSKTISGGTQAPPYALAPVTVACKGINGCITVLKNIRTGKKAQLANSQKQLVKFVNESNGMVKKQLGAYAEVLSKLQKNLKTQFSRMNRALDAMGAKTVNPTAAIEAEALKQSETKGKDGSAGIPGPFENPKSMSGVLSGLMQPDGMMNFQENGLKEVREAAEERLTKKKEAIDKKLTEFKDATKEFRGLKKECLASTGDKVSNLDCGSDATSYTALCTTSETVNGVTKTFPIPGLEGKDKDLCDTLKENSRLCSMAKATKGKYGSGSTTVDNTVSGGKGQ